MLIQGNYYREGSAAQVSATLRSDDKYFTIETESGASFSGSLESILVSDRLGNIERKLTFADGSIFATQDNESVDNLFHQSLGFKGFIHVLESKLKWVAVALVATVLFSFGFIRYGVPWLGETIAHLLPYQVNELISDGSLDFLDKHFFEESQLDDDKKQQIEQHFTTNLVPLDETDLSYQLEFRAWNLDEQAIPNAFALPDGTIILTDKFVELAESQTEIDSVLLHEMGHVVHRHSLEMVVEGAILSALVMLVTGDNTAIVDAGLGLGSFLVTSHYSRNHESEADLYAFKKMLVAGIDPQAFSDIMQRMTDYMNESEQACQSREQAADEACAEEEHYKSDEQDSLFDYLSSHPKTAERIEQAERYSECFRLGLKVCE